MASTGAYVAVAACCSVCGFAAGVAGDLLRQRLLGGSKGATSTSAEVVPDVEQNNLQASFLEPPCAEGSLQSRPSLRFAVAAAEPDGEPHKESEGSFSTIDSVQGHAYGIADALPYLDEDESSSRGAALADALPYGAHGSLEDAQDFVPDLSKCLPGCLNPAEGVHHAKCPNHRSSLRAAEPAAAEPAATAEDAAEPEGAAEEPMSLADRIRRSGGTALPYCQSFERKALPYLD